MTADFRMILMISTNSLRLCETGFIKEAMKCYERRRSNLIGMVDMRLLRRRENIYYIHLKAPRKDVHFTLLQTKFS